MLASTATATDHREVHPSMVKDCDGCAARIRSISLSPTIGASTRTHAPSPTREPSLVNRNSWEAGTLKDHRGVPIHDERGAIPIKRGGEQRHKIKDAITRLDTHPNPLGGA